MTRLSRAEICLFLLPWIAGASLLVGLLFLRLPPDGVRRLSFTLDGSSPWFNPFIPSQRVSQAGVQSGGWIGQRIFKGPVYANARVPGVFDQVEIALEVRPSTQSLIELGLSQDAAGETFEIRPLWSQALSKGWRQTAACGWRGFVREDQPDAVLCQNDFEHSVLWFATSSAPKLMDTAPVEKSYEVSLRGSHDFYALPVDGKIRFDFTLQDMNRRPGTDAAIFRLSKDGVLLWSDALATGEFHAGQPSGMFQKRIEMKGLSGGVYQLSVSAPDDIFLRHISTPLRHWVIGPRLYVGDQVDFRAGVITARAWTNTRHLTVETTHRESLQTIYLGSASATLSHTHEVQALDREIDELIGPVVFLAPRGDVRVIGDGFFAFDSEALFLPQPRHLTPATDPNAEGIQTVLTSYEPVAQTSDGWMIVRAQFPIQPRQETLRLVLSVPESTDRSGLDVRHVTLVYRRLDNSWTGWGKALLRELAMAWHAL